MASSKKGSCVQCVYPKSDKDTSLCYALMTSR